jgi:trimeric autotransporter adhesin
LEIWKFGNLEIWKLIALIIVFNLFSDKVFSQSTYQLSYPNSSRDYKILGGNVAYPNAGAASLVVGGVNTAYYGGNLTLSSGAGTTSPGSIFLLVPTTSAAVKIGTSTSSLPITISGGGNIVTSGSITAGSFSGSGSGLTNIPAASITGTFGSITSNGTITGNGSGLTNISAAIITGTFGSITSNGTITGNGAGLTNISASSIVGTFGNIIASSNLSLGGYLFIGPTNNSVSIWYDGAHDMIDSKADLLINYYSNKNIALCGAVSANSFSTNSIAIGTSTVPSGYKLAVKGGIIAEEVRVVVAGTIPDYVFEDTYKLTSLSEKEQYVKTNKHLPGIPSAKEFKEKGYSVGEMDNMLLKQVEELTLHMIALEKENKKLAAEVESLKKQ